jgi:proline iminopeptidase
MGRRRRFLGCDARFGLCPAASGTSDRDGARGGHRRDQAGDRLDHPRHGPRLSREWERFVSTVAPADRDGDLSAAYARMLAHPDPEIRLRAAHEWYVWEDTHISLGPGSAPRLQYEDPDFQLTFARLVTHYWSNGCFLAEDEILLNTDRLAGIPAVLIHGRYDVSGPLDTVWHLHRSWPDSRLVVLDDAGHGGGTLTSELVGTLDSFRALR